VPLTVARGNALKLQGHLDAHSIFVNFLNPKILRNWIWIAGYFWQSHTYSITIPFSSKFLCNSLKS
jgi:hypothetical protein